jgi:hypothetical protein
MTSLLAYFLNALELDDLTSEEAFWETPPIED